MPTIRIDNDVYSWLKSQAVPFEDNPNSVLRRFAGLDANKGVDTNDVTKEKGESEMVTGLIRRGRQITGKYLKELWKVDVTHALYHRDGTWFENLREFPGALFDFSGYVIFKTEQEYNESPYINIGQQLNVHNGISSIPGYKKMR